MTALDLASRPPPRKSPARRLVLGPALGDAAFLGERALLELLERLARAPHLPVPQPRRQLRRQRLGQWAAPVLLRRAPGRGRVVDEAHAAPLVGLRPARRQRRVPLVAPARGIEPQARPAAALVQPPLHRLGLAPRRGNARQLALAPFGLAPAQVEQALEAEAHGVAREKERI